MKRTQAGVTFIGWIVLLIPVAILLYTGIRLIPIYLNYVKVANAVEQAADENMGEARVNVSAVRNSIAKRFDIEGITHPDPSEIVVRRDGEDWVIEASYEHIAPLFAGIDLLVTFDKRAVIQ
jgi:hypothetical protein